MPRCWFDTFPIELIYIIFNYLLAHEIFQSFTHVSSYLDLALVTYLNYRVDLTSILKSDFDVIFHRLRPNQVVSLTFSDGDDTPCQTKLFLLNFRIDQFNRLRSLTLPDVRTDWFYLVLSNLDKLECLDSVSFLTNQFSDRIYERSDRMTKFTIENRLNQTSLSRLRHLTISNCYYNDLNNIFSGGSQLQSLDIHLYSFPKNIESFPNLPRLTKLILKIDDKNDFFFTTSGSFTMNTIEMFLWKLPRLRHLVLSGKAHINIADGRRWEILAIDLVTFNFNFKLEVDRIDTILESFRTPFWLERKRWFVAYKDHCLFSVPYFADTIASHPFYPPVHSTSPDHVLFFQHINHLQLPEVPIVDLHYFTQIQTLELGCTIPLTTLQTMIDLSRVRHLMLDKSANLSNISILPNLDKLWLGENFRCTFENVRQMQPMEQIRSLSLERLLDNRDCDLKQLFRIFPCVTHLHVNRIDSIIYIGRLVDEFKHLSSASFNLHSLFKKRGICFLRRPNMVISSSRWLAKNTFVCRTIRLDQYSVNFSIWIGEQVSLSSFSFGGTFCTCLLF